MTSIINASNAGAGGIIQTADASGFLDLRGGNNTGVTVSNTGIVTLSNNSVLNTPASVSLANATNFLSVNDVTVYLTSNQLLGNQNAAILNTGSIGAAGQKWEIEAQALIGATVGATIAGVAIYNGTSYVAGGGGVATYDNWPVTSRCKAVVTLSGATTFTLYCYGNNGNAYVYYIGYGAGGPSGATFISARRLT